MALSLENEPKQDRTKENEETPLPRGRRTGPLDLSAMPPLTGILHRKKIVQQPPLFGSDEDEPADAVVGRSCGSVFEILRGLQYKLYEDSKHSHENMKVEAAPGKPRKQAPRQCRQK